MVYLSCTATGASFITSNKARMRLPLPKKLGKSTTKKRPKSTSLPSDVTVNSTNKRIRTSGWISAKKGSKNDSKNDSTKKSSSNAKKNNSKKKDEEVIDLLGDSDEDFNVYAKESTTRHKSKGSSDTSAFSGASAASDDDSEYEFEG